MRSEGYCSWVCLSVCLLLNASRPFLLRDIYMCVRITIDAHVQYTWCTRPWEDVWSLWVAVDLASYAGRAVRRPGMGTTLYCWSFLQARHAHNHNVKLLYHQEGWMCVNLCVEPRDKPSKICLTKPIAKRATETSEQTVHRREQDKANIRASETSEQTIMQYCADGFALQCSS